MRYLMSFWRDVVFYFSKPVIRKQLITSLHHPEVEKLSAPQQNVDVDGTRRAGPWSLVSLVGWTTSQTHGEQQCDVCFSSFVDSCRPVRPLLLSADANTRAQTLEQYCSTGVKYVATIPVPAYTLAC